jgi:hypothetical protein
MFRMYLLSFPNAYKLVWKLRIEKAQKQPVALDTYQRWATRGKSTP